MRNVSSIIFGLASGLNKIPNFKKTYTHLRTKNKQKQFCLAHRSIYQHRAAEKIPVVS